MLGIWHCLYRVLFSMESSNSLTESGFTPDKRKVCKNEAFAFLVHTPVKTLEYTELYLVFFLADSYRGLRCQKQHPTV